MDDGNYQWDDAKAASNYAKHGVTFEAARDAFKDPFAIEFIDDREDYGEDRFILIGWRDSASWSSLTQCETSAFA